ncbi:hypothetical protein ASG21_13625 [Chryseobacterium sp. Leaf394]|nr:hypothetical protein ASG21_13625 [Chryseobacterium sp. Leaf394]
MRFSGIFNFDLRSSFSFFMLQYELIFQCDKFSGYSLFLKKAFVLTHLRLVNFPILITYLLEFRQYKLREEIMTVSNFK